MYFLSLLCLGNEKFSKYYFIMIFFSSSYAFKAFCVRETQKKKFLNRVLILKFVVFQMRIQLLIDCFQQILFFRENRIYFI